MKSNLRFTLFKALDKLARLAASRFELVSTVHCRYNFKIRNNILDVIGRRLLLFGVWEPSISELLKSRFKEPSVFIDVGAHVGYHSILVAQAMEGKGKVYSIEPNREIFGLLLENISLNSLENSVHPMLIAVSDGSKRSGFLRSPLRSNSGTSSLVGNQGVPVKLTTLSELFETEASDIQGIKIDVEGHEFEVIRGAINLIRKLKSGSFLIIELSFASDKEQETVLKLKNLIYEARTPKQIVELTTFYSYDSYVSYLYGLRGFQLSRDKTSKNILIEF